MRSFVNYKRQQYDSDSASTAMLTDKILFALFNKWLVCRTWKEKTWMKHNVRYFL